LFICFLLYSAFVTGPKKRAEASRLKTEFIQRVGLDENYNKKVGTTNNNSVILYNESLLKGSSFYCAQCGTLLKKRVKFCITCGDSTADELAMLDDKS